MVGGAPPKAAERQSILTLDTNYVSEQLPALRPPCHLKRLVTQRLIGDSSSRYMARIGGILHSTGR
jgi:hypothetical protein